jgi:hypothetical protein
MVYLLTDLVKDLNVLIDDIMICALLLNEKNVYEEDIECIPEALHFIYKISFMLGIKMRYSTVNMVLNYVKSLNELREMDVEEVIMLLKELISNSNDIEKLYKISQKISKIIIGKEINITINPLDSIELSLTALYAMFLSSLNRLNSLETYMYTIPTISMQQTSIETITI